MDNQFNNGNQNYGGQPYGQPNYGQPQYNQQQYDQQQYNQQQYNQPQYDQQQYNQPQYDQQQYNQQQYNQPQYDQQQYNQQQYNQSQYNQQQYNEPVNNAAPKNKHAKHKEKKSKMSVGWLLALCASIIVIIVGVSIICFIFVGKKKQIKNVKDASIRLTNASYTATYGELFSKSITDAKWDYFKEDGEKLVQVRGNYKAADSGKDTPVIVQFNVDNGVKLSCVALDGNAYSLADSEYFISVMYSTYYGADDSKYAASDNTDVNVINTEVTEATTEGTTQALTEATTQTTTQATTQAATEATTEETKNEYVLENSSKEYITKADLNGFTKEECRIARNEIYARHGRLFDDDELQAYFYSCSWYVGRIAPSEFDESVLSAVEKANLEVIISFETDMGYR